jgi:predicted  nucleic acid-binding Zn-ribbon protein
MLEEKDLQLIKGIVKETVDESIEKFAIIVGQSFAKMDERFDKIEQDIREMREEIASLKYQLAMTNERLDKLEERMARIEEKVDKVIEMETGDILIINKEIENLKLRITVLEKRAAELAEK